MGEPPGHALDRGVGAGHIPRAALGVQRPAITVTPRVGPHPLQHLVRGLQPVPRPLDERRGTDSALWALAVRRVLRGPPDLIDLLRPPGRHIVVADQHVQCGLLGDQAAELLILALTAPRVTLQQRQRVNDLSPPGGPLFRGR